MMVGAVLPPLGKAVSGPNYWLLALEYGPCSVTCFQWSAPNP